APAARWSSDSENVLTDSATRSTSNPNREAIARTSGARESLTNGRAFGIVGGDMLLDRSKDERRIDYVPLLSEASRADHRKDRGKSETSTDNAHGRPPENARGGYQTDTA